MAKMGDLAADMDPRPVYIVRASDAVADTWPSRRVDQLLGLVNIEIISSSDAIAAKVLA